MLKTTINTQIAFKLHESEITAHIETLKQEDLILIQSICGKIGIDYRYVFIKRRYRELVTARCIICHYLYKLGYTLVNIGNLLSTSGYDHITVIYALKQHNNLNKVDAKYQSIFNLTLEQPTPPRYAGLSYVNGAVG